MTTIWEHPTSRELVGEAAKFCHMVEQHFKGYATPWQLAPNMSASFTEGAKWYAARHPELYEQFIANRTLKRLTN